MGAWAPIGVQGQSPTGGLEGKAAPEAEDLMCSALVKTFS